MDPQHVASVERMGTHHQEGTRRVNSLADLLKRCELVVLSANNNHVKDLQKLADCRKNSGGSTWCWPVSPAHSAMTTSPTSRMCSAKRCPVWDFLRVPSAWSSAQSSRRFKANFVIPMPLTALLGARMLDRLPKHSGVCRSTQR